MPQVSERLLRYPIEQIQQQQVVFIMNSGKDNDAQDAEVVDDGQKSLPEGEKE